MKGKARDARIDQLLDMVKLPRSVRHRHPSGLSGGRSSVSISPGRLRPNHRSSSAMKSPRRSIPWSRPRSSIFSGNCSGSLNLSYIFISHDLSVVETICDEIVVMYGGQKVEHLETEAIKSPTHPYSKLLFSSVPKLDPKWLDNLQQDAEPGAGVFEEVRTG